MKQINPLVSILIPVYNRHNTISRAIESARNQTYQNIEIIIVDNCSTDNTFSIIEQYSIKDARIKKYQQEENVGPVRNWLTCIKKSKGEYIKFLWSDDFIEQNCIEELLRPMISDSSIGFSYSKVDIVYETKQYIEKDMYSINKRRIKYNSSDFVLSTMGFGYIVGFNTPVSPGCALFRRETVENYLIVNFDNNLNLDFSKYGAGNDLFLFLGACNDYKYFSYIDKKLSVFFGGEDSFSVSIKLDTYYEFVKKYFINQIYKKKFVIFEYNLLKLLISIYQKVKSK